MIVDQRKRERRGDSRPEREERVTVDHRKREKERECVRERERE